ncbi:XrtA/PEP-CTERM system-associated ATPase [Nitrosomonas eutropha]|uniref:XrtA/PEP-CTERM system-associated ATPase n=1 Tax=Nitrosomonas eutropha TaxID=916 RepID=UPI0008CAD07D|nr:putative secretion ATPase, PEP-CTERM locus subfamily [Nitrosomonas eutropha]
MYLTYYGFTEKPFQLKPDPSFFFPSRGHKRAAAYLEYGLSQEDGFIIITGEVGAGKTTLMRYLFQKLKRERVVAAQLVSTRLDPDDALRMVAAAFSLPYEGLSKAALLLDLERFMRKCEREGTRVLLVVDEAQNLQPQTLEELRMLSNFQSDNRPLLQTFLLGQPEFRRTLLGNQMQQLRQRVIATYHLGPLDQAETRAYIEHRLQKAGWNGNPVFQDEIFEIIHNFSTGIPRKINMFCDRLLIMGCLEELQALSKAEANEVMLDIQKEFDLTVSPE